MPALDDIESWQSGDGFDQTPRPIAERFPTAPLPEASPSLPNLSAIQTLPLEVTERIYYHHMSAFIGTVTVSPTHMHVSPFVPAFLPAICLVNKTLRTQAGLVFIRNCTFRITSHSALFFLQQFLGTFEDGQGFAAVRQVEFTHILGTQGPCATTFPGVTTMGFLVQCRGLQYVELAIQTWSMIYLARRSNVTGGRKRSIGQRLSVPMGVAEIVKVFHLDMLLDCLRLKSVVWNGFMSLSLKDLEQHAKWFFERVCEGLEKEFLGRRRRVDVRVEWKGDIAF